jgi:hypothetical protein
VRAVRSRIRAALRRRGGTPDGSWVGPLPARADCDCRICRPGELADDHEQRCVDVVLEHGWQVTLVGAGDGEDEPAFAYTVGLAHRQDHPELVVSGLSPELMHSVLNDVAARVVSGHRFPPGTGVEGALGKVPVLVEAVTEEGLEQSVTWSRWFHRAPTPAVQLVWPDTSGRFAWQREDPGVLEQLQPPGWHTPSDRSGAFAVAPDWPMPVPADTLAFVCTHVAEDGETVRFVAREPHEDRGEDWSAHCGVDEHETAQIVLLHLEHVLRSAPSVRLLADLGLGETAWREGPDQPWERAPADSG